MGSAACDRGRVHCVELLTANANVSSKRGKVAQRTRRARRVFLDGLAACDTGRVHNPLTPSNGERRSQIQRGEKVARRIRRARRGFLHGSCLLRH